MGDHSTRTGVDPPAASSGGGGLAESIREFDWSATPLGPLDGWPQALRTALRIALASRHPMALWWGPHLTNFYNDAYTPVLGQRHPAALGQPAARVWAEIWDTLGPQAEVVLEQGRATWNEEQLLPMERNGFPEETYFTYSYSPVPDDHGGVGGLLITCTEDTKRVLSERRLRTLRALGERAAAARSAEGACGVAAATLGDNPHDIPFALLYHPCVHTHYDFGPLSSRAVAT